MKLHKRSFDCIPHKLCGSQLIVYPYYQRYVWNENKLSDTQMLITVIDVYKKEPSLFNKQSNECTFLTLKYGELHSWVGLNFKVINLW